MKRVSVIIPIYNSERLLLETLRAVAAQVGVETEIIVVDDESPDASAQVALDSGIPLRLLRQANAGVSRARNTGLAAATGDFVCFLDQDDIWHPRHLHRLVQGFESQPECGVAFTHFRHWYPEQGVYAPPESLWPAEWPQTPDPAFSGWIYHQFLRDCWALTSATMIRRSVLLEHGSFDEGLAYSEDWDLWLRLSRAVPFVCLPGASVLYRQHAVQGSRAVREKDFRTDLLLSHVQAHGLESRDGRRMDRRAFDLRIARYQAEFGYHHLQFGDRRKGVVSLWRAWQRRPLAVHYLALAGAAAAGWRPRVPKPE